MNTFRWDERRDKQLATLKEMGLGYPEIAEVMGCSVGAARCHWEYLTNKRKRQASDERYRARRKARLESGIPAEKKPPAIRMIVSPWIYDAESGVMTRTVMAA